jgi:arginyl-tRNA synthetase
MLVSERLTTLIERALVAAMKDGALGAVPFPSESITVERPKQNIHGDLTCGVAMKLASGANMPPFAIANVLVSYIRNDDSLPSNAVTDLSIAPEGFLNFKLGSAWLSASLLEIHKLGDDFGRSKFGNDQKVSIDYGSPLRSRNTFYGQTLANLFRWSGYLVCEDPDSADFDSCDISIHILAAQNGTKIKQLKELKAESSFNLSCKREMILLQPVKHKGTGPGTGDDGDQRTAPRAIAEQKSTTLVDTAADAELLNTIDDDVLRYFLVDTEPGNQTILDTELSKQASRINSAFYVRHAHARCCAMMRQVLDSRINIRGGVLDPPLLSEAQFQEYLLQYKSYSDVFEEAFSINSEIFSYQKELVMTLQSFPVEISEALLKRQPGRITRFARTVADDMSRWYEVNRVITDNTAVIGVSAPTIM